MEEMPVDAASLVEEHPDGRVELRDESVISSSPLYNHDLAPVAVAKRDWSTYNYAALWVGMAACIPTYMLSSGLIASGMNWWQAIMTILLGNVIVLIPILLNSHPGTKYGIPFPVFARAAYGTYGSNLPALMRALVACGWFGIQSWLGGKALFTIFTALHKDWPTMLGGPVLLEHSATEWISFFIFWSLNVLVIYRGMDLLKKIEGLAAPFVLLMCGALVVWAVTNAHGVGTLLSDPGKFKDVPSFIAVFIPSLTGMIGFWATLSLNMPDFTRYGRSQREQTIGQVVALPAAMTLLSMMGVIVTSAALVIYPQASSKVLWDPINLISMFTDPLTVCVSMFTVAVATLAMNIAANVVSPANDFSNAFPRYINFRTGGLITAILGILMQPWKLIADPSGYIFQWLVGYSGGLGSIAGVLIIDYWIIKKKKLELPDLYLPDGVYKYQKGSNPAALIATVVGCALAWVGWFYAPLKILFDYAWFVGFATSGIIYYLMMSKSAKPEENG